MEDISAQDNELNSYRTNIRTKRNYVHNYIKQKLNLLSSQPLEDKITGIENIFNCIQHTGYKISPNEIDIHSFYIMLHIYIHMIHSDNPDLRVINMIICILRFSDLVDLSDIEKKLKLKKNKYLIFNPDKIPFPYKKEYEVQSLAQPDSLQFLQTNLFNPLLSRNCLLLLTMIARNKPSQIFFIVCPNFYNFIQMDPNSPYGKIISIYFKKCIEGKAQHFDKIEKLGQILYQMLTSGNDVKISYSIKIANLIYTKALEFYSVFQQTFDLLNQKLPEFIVSNCTKVVVQSIALASNIRPVSDAILLATFRCLPFDFKKNHELAFKIVSQNLERLFNLVQHNVIVNVIQNCFLSSHTKVKENALALLNQVMQKINVVNLLDIETLFLFLDNPNLAALVLPLIIAVIDSREKNGDLAFVLEALSNNIDQITELTENENENIAKLASDLIIFYESH